MSAELYKTSMSDQVSGQARPAGHLDHDIKKGSGIPDGQGTPESLLSDSIFSKSVCSSTDCTGLIPTPPSSEAELEAYEEMYQFCTQPSMQLPVQEENSTQSQK